MKRVVAHDYYVGVFVSFKVFFLPRFSLTQMDTLRLGMQ